MILLIDAYNILKQTIGSGFIDEPIRKQFIKTMATYATHKSHEIVLIFDGGPYERPTTFHKAGISIIYAGRRLSADDVIKKMVVNRRHEIAVVSSDQALCQFVEQYGACVLASDAFYDFVQHNLAEKPITVVKGSHDAKKLHHEQTPELDKLMQEATRQVLIKTDDTTYVSEPSRRKLSKTEKRVAKVIKKL